jgi:putative transposase
VSPCCGELPERPAALEAACEPSVVGSLWPLPAWRPRSILLDQAGWHGAKALKVPSNISLLQLPPRAPELNGPENIWQFMRQNWLSNRIFKSFDDIVDHCCYAWNTLIDQPWKIMSIARRDWAAAGHSI